MDDTRLAELLADPNLTAADKLAAARREGFDPDTRDLGVQTATDPETGDQWRYGVALAEVRIGDRIHGKTISYSAYLPEDAKPQVERAAAYALLYAYVYGELR